MLLLNEVVPIYINNSFEYLTNLLHLSLLIISANYILYDNFNSSKYSKRLFIISIFVACFTCLFIIFSFRNLLTFTASLPDTSANYLITNQPEYLSIVSIFAAISLILTVVGLLLKIKNH